MLPKFAMRLTRSKLTATSLTNAQNASGPDLSSRSKASRLHVTTQMRFFLASQLIMSGNSFCQIIRNQAGEVLALQPLDAWRMTQKWDTSDPKNPILYWMFADYQGGLRRFIASRVKRDRVQLALDYEDYFKMLRVDDDSSSNLIAARAHRWNCCRCDQQNLLSPRNRRLSRFLIVT